MKARAQARRRLNPLPGRAQPSAVSRRWVVGWSPLDHGGSFPLCDQHIYGHDPSRGSRFYQQPHVARLQRCVLEIRRLPWARKKLGRARGGLRCGEIQPRRRQMLPFVHDRHAQFASNAVPAITELTFERGYVDVNSPHPLSKCHRPAATKKNAAHRNLSGRRFLIVVYRKVESILLSCDRRVVHAC